VIPKTQSKAQLEAISHGCRHCDIPDSVAVHARNRKSPKMGVEPDMMAMEFDNMHPTALLEAKG
jgi:hypothetical protein